LLDDLLSGLRLVRNTPVLRSLLLLCAPIYLVFGLENALLLPFATQALHATTFEYGLFEVALTIGFTFGCLLLTRIADRLHPAQWIVVGLFGMGAMTMLYSHLSGHILVEYQ